MVHIPIFFTLLSNLKPKVSHDSVSLILDELA